MVIAEAPTATGNKNGDITPSVRPSVATIKATTPNGEFMQRVYITTKKGYAVEFFFTYLDAADLPVFDAIMKSDRIDLILASAPLAASPTTRSSGSVREATTSSTSLQGRSSRLSGRRGRCCR